MNECIKLMELHQRNKHDSSFKQKPPKIDRPDIKLDMGEDDWEAFKRRWKLFKNGTDVSPTQVVPQLIACCESDLESALFREDAELSDKTEDQVLEAIRKLAVLKVALTTRRTQLLERVTQDHGERVQQFVSRIKGLASVCQWSVKGSCKGATCTADFTDTIVKLVTIKGLADEAIKKEILGTPDIDSKTLLETVALIDSKEIAARAMTSSGPGTPQLMNAATTSYSREKKAPPVEKMKFEAKAPAQSVKPGSNNTADVPQIKCGCGKMFPQYGSVRGRVKAFKCCRDCWVPPDKKPGKKPSENAGIESLFHSLDSVTMTSETCSSEPVREPAPVWRKGRAAIPIDHHVFDGSYGWKQADATPHSTVKLSVRTNPDAFKQLNIPARNFGKEIITECVADSGAQTELLSLKIFHRMGLKKSDLIPVKKKMKAANNEEIKLLGATFLRIGSPDMNGTWQETKAMCYVTDSTDRFYLSKASMMNLGMLPPEFPAVGAAATLKPERNKVCLSENTSTLGVTSCQTASSGTAECECVKRTDPPPRPKQLPFSPSLDNAEQMKQWLLEYFKSSTFNTCTHQPMPMMSGPDMELKVDPNAKPYVTHRPVSVPLHWQEQVKETLRNLVDMGVLSKPPPNTPLTWLHPMVVTGKADGTPRIVVDMQKLNAHLVPEKHYSGPPAKQARAVPPNSVKTVADQWKGFDSIGLAESSKHLTTFLTEDGPLQHNRGPQGCSVTQDAYTQRYDSILKDVPRRQQVVDDTLLYDPVEQIEEHWWRIIDFLILTGKNGVVINPKKFQFSEMEVDYAGFHISASNVRPLPKCIDSIAQFPQPKNISDIRSWHGLVHQVAHYGKISEIMAPFRPLLSPKNKFEWTEDLEVAFQRSKALIIEEIKEGVEIFDPERKTCLTTDWSKSGIGYFLHQQHCECFSDNPGCCKDGWRVTLAGSRFLKDAETRYAPVEGEALAVAWALEDSKYFTVGCPNLVIATDHKPLVKILGDRELADISNPRLFRIKQRTLSWRYKIIHVAGTSNAAADALSRQRRDEEPHEDGSSSVDVLAAVRVSPDECQESEQLEIAVTLAAKSFTADSLGAVTWDTVKAVTESDEQSRALRDMVHAGFPESREDVPQTLREFWQYRNKLFVIDNVVMMDGRVYIPAPLRSQILCNLHAAHQGENGMGARSRNDEGSTFWPGQSCDITSTRDACRQCDTIAPSQSRLPPEHRVVPSRPFQAVAADYCESQRHILRDRCRHIQFMAIARAAADPKA